MLTLRRFMCGCFGFFASVHFLALIFFGFVLGNLVLATLLILILTVLYGMAWWTIWRAKSSARRWAIAASLATLLEGILPVLFTYVSLPGYGASHNARHLIHGGLEVALGIAGLVAFGPRDAMAQLPAKPETPRVGVFQMPIITIKVKAKRYPLWHYAVASVIAIVNSFFFAWMAYSKGFGPSAARQVFLVFLGLQMFFLPLLYFANERRFRDHNSRAVQWVASAFAGLMGAVVLYFLAVHDLKGDPSTRFLSNVISLVCLAIGVLLCLFGIKYEVE